jgi:hypothetical protein
MSSSNISDINDTNATGSHGVLAVVHNVRFNSIQTRVNVGGESRAYDEQRVNDDKLKQILFSFQSAQAASSAKRLL